MKPERHLGATLAALLLLGGLWLAGTAQDAVQTTPNLDHPPTATVGIPFTGVASDLGGYVEVEVTCEGQPLPGSPDTVMENGVNQFDFNIPEHCRNKDITIIARTSDGRETVHRVHVN